MATENKNFKAAKYYSNKYGAYIEYKVLHPISGEWKRKRISLNRLKYRVRKKEAKKLVDELNVRLATGWNPFEEIKVTSENVTFADAFSEYKTLKQKELKKLTFRLYSKNIRILIEFLAKKRIYKVREFTKLHAKELLNYLYIDKNWSEVTYNKFKSFCVTIWNYFISNDYCDINPFKDFKKKKERLKIRRFFDDETLQMYFEYLNDDLWFKFYSFLTYYTLIRPNEITLLKFKDFNLKDWTIIIPPEVSKNGKRQVVTIPIPMQRLMVVLNFERFHKEMFVYSGSHTPGYKYRDPRYITKKFARIRKKLKFPMEYQFYSLKDTGIIKMLKAGVPPNVVRDQARHYSLEVTNKYVQLASEGAFKEVLDKVNY